MSDIPIKEELVETTDKKKEYAKEGIPKLRRCRIKKTHLCSICNKLFPRRRNLEVHHLTHTGEKPHVCQVCNRAFSDKSCLYKHNFIHTKERPHVCSICNRAFSLKNNLNAHYLTHTGERPHKCEICNKAFAKGSHLSRHHRIHTKERPFICNMCDATFTQKSHLNVHVLIHGGRKPLFCEVCNKKFLDKSALKKHSNIHTRDKPFLCTICGKEFANKSILTDHQLTHKRFICKDCTKTFPESHPFINHHIKMGNSPNACDMCKKEFVHSYFEVSSVLQLEGESEASSGFDVYKVNQCSLPLEFCLQPEESAEDILPDLRSEKEGNSCEVFKDSLMKHIKNSCEEEHKDICYRRNKKC